MDPEVRAKLVEAIVRAYTIEQLNMIVRGALQQDLEVYVSTSDRRSIVVDNLLAHLERTPDDCQTLLLKIRTSAVSLDLRAAVDAYYGVPPGPNPYDEVLILGDPFVDRHISRNKLRDLFLMPNRRAMIVRGPEATGKSYSRNIIEHVCRSMAIEPVFVQLKGIRFEEMLADLINMLNLPVKEFHDRMAQYSTMRKGFVTALRGHISRMPAGQRWCLIFDSHNHETAPAEARTFVDELLVEVASLRLLPIWMVVLGYSATTVPGNVIADDLVHVTQPDVDNFLVRVSTLTGRPLAGQALTDTSAAIFNGLAAPFDHEKMNTLTSRLRDKVMEWGAA